MACFAGRTCSVMRDYRPQPSIESFLELRTFCRRVCRNRSSLYRCFVIDGLASGFLILNSVGKEIGIDRIYLVNHRENSFDIEPGLFVENHDTCLCIPKLEHLRCYIYIISYVGTLSFFQKNLKLKIFRF